MSIQIDPSDYLDLGADNNASIDEIQTHQLKNAAANYAQRAHNTATPDGSDLELINLQARLSRSTNPLEQMQLEQQINQMASSLVGQPLPVKETPRQSSKDVVLGEYGQEAYQKTMDWAGDNLSDSVAASINEVLQSNTDDAVVAFQGLKELSSLGENAFIDPEDIQPLEQGLSNELVSRYGEAGEHLVTLTEAMAQGVATPAEAMKLAITNPKLRAAAIDAARAGLIALPI